MFSFQNTPAYLLEIVFKEDATAYELFTIAIAFSVLWGVVFSVATPLLRSLTYGRPWLRSMCEKDYERGHKDLLEVMGKKLTKDEAIDEMMKEWAWTQVMFIQHTVGALLCVPSLFGLGDPSWASSLAACGILSEMGWEIEHTFEVMYKFFVKGGDAPHPFLLFHHCLTSVLGLPMVLHYRNLKPLHWLCFDLQVSATFFWLLEYAKSLDISKPKDLSQFKAINFLMLVVMVWARLLHWIYCCVQINITWYHDKAWTFMAVGSIVLLAFSLSSALGCVVPMYKRFMKFLHVSAEYESLPPDASEKKRRQSAVNLQMAVSELLLEGSLDMADRVELFLESLEGRKTSNKRQTLPPRRRMTMRSMRMMQYKSAPVLKVD